MLTILLALFKSVRLATFAPPLSDQELSSRATRLSTMGIPQNAEGHAAFWTKGEQTAMGSEMGLTALILEGSGVKPLSDAASI